jgi:DNA-binding response OmpR family regulator
MGQQNHVILIVEDDEDLLIMLKEHFRGSEGLEISVMGASSCQEADRLLRSCKVDCLVTDINLGEESGTMLIERAREKGIPVVAMSGKSDNKDTALASGASSFLEKPFSGECLFSAIVGAFGPVAE